jgi:hypothetical protein
MNYLQYIIRLAPQGGMVLYVRDAPVAPSRGGWILAAYGSSLQCRQLVDA